MISEAMPVTRLELERIKINLPFQEIVAETIEEMIRDGELVIVPGGRK